MCVPCGGGCVSYVLLRARVRTYLRAYMRACKPVQ